MADDADATAELCFGAALTAVAGEGLWVTRTSPPTDAPPALATLDQHRRRTKYAVMQHPTNIIGMTMPKVSTPLPSEERGRGDELGDGTGRLQPLARLVRQTLAPLEQLNQTRL